MIKRLLLCVLLVLGCWSYANAQGGSDRDVFNEVGKDLLNQWDAEAYRNVVDLLNQIMEYDNQEVTNWGMSCLAGMKSAITEPYQGISDGYKLLIRAANFSGHFKAVNNRWVKEGAADDVQFSFTDKNGSPCVFRFYTQGATKTITMPYEEDEEEDDWGDYEDEEDASFFDNRIINDLMNGVKLISLEVPEQIYLTMTQGGRQLMETHFIFDLSVLTDNWDPLVNGFIVSMNASFAKSGTNMGANGMSLVKGGGPGTFEMGMDRVGYKPGTGINFSFYAKKDGNQLVSFDMNAPGTLNLEDGLFDYDLETGITIKNIGFESLNYNADVLGRIQAKGTIPDLYAFYNAYSSVSKCENEAEAQQVMNQVAKMTNSNFYYNNGSESRGTFGLAPYYDEEDEMWSAIPTISFTSDNSTYPLMEYFSEENFPEFIGEMKGIFYELMEIATTLKENMDKMTEDALMGVDNQPLADGLRAGAKAEIYTISGRLCTRTSIGADGKVSLSSLPNGVYIVKTSSGTRKFIKR